MKRLLLSLLLFTSLNIFGQSLSKTHIIYESKDQIVMNDGTQYQILAENHFDKNLDQSISKQKTVLGHTLVLHRILVIKSDEKSFKLVEWSKDNVKFYELSKDMDFGIEKNQTADSDLQAND